MGLFIIGGVILIVIVVEDGEGSLEFGQEEGLLLIGSVLHCRLGVRYVTKKSFTFTSTSWLGKLKLSWGTWLAWGRRARLRGICIANYL